MNTMYDCVFFFNDTATTEIFTLSLHDALPIFDANGEPIIDFADVIAAEISGQVQAAADGPALAPGVDPSATDRKSTRLNSSHGYISYAVFCLKKKKTHTTDTLRRSNHQHSQPH